MSYKRYSKEEDLLIRKKVEETPNNLSLAFENAAKELPNRSVMGISVRWYSAVRKSNPSFGLISRKGAVANIKNTPRKSEDIGPMSIKDLVIQHLTDIELGKVLRRIIVFSR